MCAFITGEFLNSALNEIHFITRRHIAFRRTFLSKAFPDLLKKERKQNTPAK